MIVLRVGSLPLNNETSLSACGRKLPSIADSLTMGCGRCEEPPFAANSVCKSNQTQLRTGARRDCRPVGSLDDG